MNCNEFDYLKNFDIQKIINKLTDKYKDKRIVLYGAGKFAQYLFNHYSFANLNIIAIADKKFETLGSTGFFNLKCICPEELNDLSYDVILISNFDFYLFKKILEEKILNPEITDKIVISSILNIEDFNDNDCNLFFTFQIKMLSNEVKRLNNEISYLKQINTNTVKETQLLRSIVENSIDITKIPKTIKTNLRQIQLIKTKLLELVDFVFNKKGIQYWLDYGSLLGALRHNGFIPWDDDIDISLLKDDYVKIPEIFDEIIKWDNNFSVSFGKWGTPIYRFSYKDYCIDFFPMEYLNKNYATDDSKKEFSKLWEDVRNEIIKSYGENVFLSVSNEFDKKFSKEKTKIFKTEWNSDENSNQIVRSVESKLSETVFAILDISNVFPLKKHAFENLSLPIPNNPVRYLEQSESYGNEEDFMSFPKITDTGFPHIQSVYTETQQYKSDYNKLTRVIKKIKENY